MPPSGGGEQLAPGHEPSNTGGLYINIIADQETAYKLKHSQKKL